MRRFGWTILSAGFLAAMLVLTGCGRSSFHLGLGSAYSSKPASYYAGGKKSGYGYTKTTVYHHHRVGHHRSGVHRRHVGHGRRGYGVRHRTFHGPRRSHATRHCY